MIAATLSKALLAAMVALLPPDRAAALPQYPGFEETAEQRTARYEAFAADAAEVALDPLELPIPGRSRSATAALIIALAFEESKFALDADRGPSCYRGANGKNARCDAGRSACSMQIHIGAGKTREGWTQADLFADRKKCFRAGLHIARRSFSACASLGVDHLLDSYSSGVCGMGSDKGRVRLATAARVERLIVSTTMGKGLL